MCYYFSYYHYYYLISFRNSITYGVSQITSSGSLSPQWKTSEGFTMVSRQKCRWTLYLKIKRGPRRAVKEPMSQFQISIPLMDITVFQEQKDLQRAWRKRKTLNKLKKKESMFHSQVMSFTYWPFWKLDYYNCFTCFKQRHIQVDWWCWT